MINPIELKNCHDDDILSFDNEVCKISKFRQKLWDSLAEYSRPLVHTLKEKLGGIHDLSITPNQDWFCVGKECEILKPSKKWQNGKIKFKLILQFCPDQPQSLDENSLTYQNINEVENLNLKNCANQDVLSFQDQACKLNIFRQHTWESFDTHSNNITSRLQQKLGIPSLSIGRILFIEGKECNLLKPYQGWQRGQIRVQLTLEFCPDKNEIVEENGHQETDNLTESPLDEIRQQLTDENPS